MRTVGGLGPFVFADVCADDLGMIDSELTEYGALLERARRARGLSKRRAAERAGISDAWWRQVVTGIQKHGPEQMRMTPSAAVLVRMARAVGADVHRVFTAAGYDDQDLEPFLPLEPDARSLADVEDETLIAEVLRRMRHTVASSQRLVSPSSHMVRPGRGRRSGAGGDARERSAVETAREDEARDVDIEGQVDNPRKPR